MILLDTSIVSAVMSVAPPDRVIQWLNDQDTATLYVSPITIAEIGYGLWILPEGRRRHDLEARFHHFIAAGFDQRIVSFEENAARIYPHVMGRRRAIGRPISALDGQIASIARAGRLTVATRNVRDFEECGVEIVDLDE